MSNYNVIFQMKTQPAFEILSINKNNQKKYIGLPGLVALDLANTTDTDIEIGAENIRNRNLGSFIKKYSFFSDSKNDETLLAKLMSFKMLTDERETLSNFIKTIFIPRLIYDETEYTISYLENLSNEERINFFFMKQDLQNHTHIDELFNALSIQPYFNLIRPNQAESINISEPEINDNINTDTIEIQVDGSEMNKKDLLTLEKYTSQIPYTWKYETDNLLTICWLELLLMAEARLHIKSCHKCTAFFSPFPANTLHCPECRKEYTAQTLYRERVKEKIMNLPEEEKEKLLQKEREEKAKYMKEYRKRKRV